MTACFTARANLASKGASHASSPTASLPVLLLVEMVLILLQMTMLKGLLLLVPSCVGGGDNNSGGRRCCRNVLEGRDMHGCASRGGDSRGKDRCRWKKVRGVCVLLLGCCAALCTTSSCWGMAS